MAVGRDLSLEMGGSQWLIAGNAHLRQAGSGIMVARNVEGQEIRVGLLLAGKVDGNIQAIMDTETAIRFGAAFGAALGLVLFLRKMFK